MKKKVPTTNYLLISKILITKEKIMTLKLFLYFTSINYNE